MIELEGLWLKNTTTALLVTHSITEAVFLSDFIVVLSARPGHIIRTLKVETPRPRSDAFLRSRGFQDLCEAVMEVFPVAD
jgi:NitT/TauT family transport system ATP-binding protein